MGLEQNPIFRPMQRNGKKLRLDNMLQTITIECEPIECVMTLNVKTLIFNKLEAPYIWKGSHMEICGGHYMVLVCEDPSCTYLDWTFVKLTKQGHKFSPWKHLYWIFNTYFNNKYQYFTHQATLFVKEVIQMLANDPNPPLDLLTCYTTLEWSREEKYM